MICPHCGKDICEKEIHVKKLDREVYIDGVPFSVLGVETLTDAKRYPYYGKGWRTITTKPPTIIYVEAE